MATSSLKSDRLPPHDESVEWRVIVHMMLHPEFVHELSNEMFYVLSCRDAFEKAAALIKAKDPCIGDWVKFVMKWPPGDTVGKLSLYNEGEPTVGFYYWKGLLLGLDARRKSIRLGSELIEAAQDPDFPMAETLMRVGKKAIDIHRETSGKEGLIDTIGTLMPVVLQELQEDYENGYVIRGIETGFTDINRAVDGLIRKCLYVVAGRPGQGKSTLLLNMACAAARAGQRVLFFSLEMPAKEIGWRLVSSIAKCDRHVFRSQQANERHFEAVKGAIQEVKKLPLEVIDDVSDLHDIAAEAGKAVARGVKLIVIDYLQRITLKNFRENRTSQVTLISNTLKDLGMGLDVPVLCAAQLNRANEKEDRRPGLADLRDSGSIEQDADVVMLLHSPKPDGSEYVSTEMLIGKNRNGPTGLIHLTFLKNIFRFESAARVMDDRNAPVQREFKSTSPDP